MESDAAKLLMAARRARNAFAEKKREVFVEHYPEKTVEEHRVKTTAGDTRVLIYRSRSLDEIAPVFVNIHGGGFVQGSAEDDGVWCRRIADSVCCNVVNVDYHLSPEHKFPIALEECYGVDRARIAVGGHSAGGNLTAALSLLARERNEFSIAFQVLNYPPLDLSLDPNRHETRDTLLTARVQLFFTACYVRDQSDIYNPLVSPLRAADLAGLPPVLLISAEYDPLREEEEMYARRLETAGVDVTYKCFRGCMHAFTHFGPEPAASEAWDLIHAHLRQAFEKR